MISRRTALEPIEARFQVTARVLKFTWAGVTLLIVFLCVRFVRGPVSLVIVMGISLMLVLFVEDLLRQGGLRALRSLPARIWQVFKIMPP